MNSSDCTFCCIVDGCLPSRKIYEDDEILVFHNRLTWVPTMLLLIPKQHMSQTELWDSGELLGKIGRLAGRYGEALCPNGFRILSNFGGDALQTQSHGHVHIIGGARLGLYVGH